jgi:hypothetical protein
MEMTVDDGDRLTVSCGGTVWSGLAFQEDNGPGGNGNVAPGGYPLPDGPQFGAIARVGSGGWFTVGASYGPAIYTGATGGLILGVNDDVGNGNTCGNAESQFSCNILVERLGVQ